MRCTRIIQPAIRRASSLLSHQTLHTSARPAFHSLRPSWKRSVNTMAALSFSDNVVGAMRKLFPEELADKAWDNTGLLLGQAPVHLKGDGRDTVLLTNDLTEPVVDEAIREKASIIVSYHPVIFKPLKSITAQDPMQANLLRLVAHGIAVYSPHTAVDAAHGGLNDWLCDILKAGLEEEGRSVCQPISRPLPEAIQGTGYGRTLQLKSPTALPTLLKNLSAGLGNQRHMSVATPHSIETLNALQNITKIAVCAGSGADVLKDSDAPLIITGEMTHHYALRYIQLGQTVVTVFHSNSERQYLTQRLKPMLEKELQNGRVVVSAADRDPFQTIDVSQLA